MVTTDRLEEGKRAKGNIKEKKTHREKNVYLDEKGRLAALRNSGNLQNMAFC